MKYPGAIEAKIKLAANYLSPEKPNVGIVVIEDVLLSAYEVFQKNLDKEQEDLKLEIDRLNTSLSQGSIQLPLSVGKDMLEMMTQLISGNKLEAIKIYKDLTGWCLRDTKEALDSITEKLNEKYIKR